MQAAVPPLGDRTAGDVVTPARASAGKSSEDPVGPWHQPFAWSSSSIGGTWRGTRHPPSEVSASPT